MKKLTVLSVAYTLAPCTPDTAGGAEQVMAALDAAIVAAGHRSIMVACQGSRSAGSLEAVPVPDPDRGFDEAARAAATAGFRDAIRRVLARESVDLIHMHGFDFHAILPPPGVPVLVTLHMPLDWYPPEALHPTRPDTWLHGVSAAQMHGRSLPRGLPPIANGVDLQALGGIAHAKRGFALNLARICPEKAPHLAIEAARLADQTLLIGGAVFPYPAHQDYLNREVLPRLDARRRWLGPLDFPRKRRLLSAARCLLLPSLAPETGSLVAMEAAACGTPVIAFPHGALPDLIEDGRSGFLVRDTEEMAAAMARIYELSPAECRRVAHERFSHRRMVADYLQRYAMLAGLAAAA